LPGFAARVDRQALLAPPLQVKSPHAFVQRSRNARS
jgi:hypothetical protein